LEAAAARAVLEAAAVKASEVANAAKRNADAPSYLEKFSARGPKAGDGAQGPKAGDGAQQPKAVLIAPPVEASFGDQMRHLFFGPGAGAAAGASTGAVPANGASPKANGASPKSVGAAARAQDDSGAASAAAIKSLFDKPAGALSDKPAGGAAVGLLDAKYVANLVRQLTKKPRLGQSPTWPAQSAPAGKGWVHLHQVGCEMDAADDASETSRGIAWRAEMKRRGGSLRAILNSEPYSLVIEMEQIRRDKSHVDTFVRAR